MMSVEWEQSALDELAKYWSTFDSHERELVREAINQADDLLARSGDVSGESRETTSIRVLFHSPIVLKYRVLFIDRLMGIKVIQFWPMYKSRN